MHVEWLCVFVESGPTLEEMKHVFAFLHDVFVLRLTTEDFIRGFSYITIFGHSHICKFIL